MRSAGRLCRASSPRPSSASSAMVRGEPRHQRVVELGLDRPLAQRAHVREAHAVGREHARQGMHQHALEAQRVGDPAGVLPGGAAEAAEHVARDVVAALDRDLLDRVRHVVDRDREAAVGDLLGRPLDAGRRRDLLGKRREPRAAPPSPSSGWSAFGPNTLGKKRGCSLPTIRLASVTVSGPPLR